MKTPVGFVGVSSGACVRPVVRSAQGPSQNGAVRVGVAAGRTCRKAAVRDLAMTTSSPASSAGKHADAQPDASKKSAAFFSNHTYLAPHEVPELLASGSEDAQSMRVRFERMIRTAQDEICAAIEKLDGKAKFRQDAWSRSGGGGGIARVLTDGAVFEKAGVNVSVVYGVMPPEAIKAATERGVARDAGFKEGEPVPYFACGISSVMHPRNPMAPTVHFNYRYFETDGGVWWFGGGTDLTPSYLFEDDIKHFHGTYKKVCDKHDPELFPKFKAWCDRYFTITHRGEMRGMGGIFFDDFNDRSPEQHLAFSTDACNAFLDAYVPIVQRRKDLEYSPKQKEWQQIRRGRYVEFNLVYDRGTIFGLKTGGRIESILMSLPETARWEYDHHPEEGSWEAKTLECMKNPVDWV
ncbi:Oxygen-dependent coproporphyrinogen-III oxidase, chloroplastic [Porphyridium purpureum]|uniref:coproporphyrinogen oxidase n=1 Tax=Porphyridium purpureum TaxID=35688 RepID=A0A5J4Z3F6_PORPP|nr:Oxygen-dependent coproporphyrinogen-III oxidase, chloroplastic [Porphyridium purpureum]|eukprot:POR8617..scf295_1